VNPPTYTARDISHIVADVIRAAYDEGAINTTAYVNIMCRFADTFDNKFSIRFDREGFINRCERGGDNKRFSQDLCTPGRMRACPDHEGRMYGCPDPAAVYTHCAACGTDLTLDNGEARSIASGLCPECGSEDIIEQED